MYFVIVLIKSKAFKASIGTVLYAIMGYLSVKMGHLMFYLRGSVAGRRNF